MKQSRATIRYAKSLISISKEQNSLETSFNDMLLVSSVCSSNKDFVNLLKTPIVKTDLKIKILNELLAKSISDLTLSFIILIAKKKREILLPEIAECFIALYKNNKNIKEVSVVTAKPLDDDLRKEVMSYIEKQSNSKIELEEIIDESLIGGAIIRMDDKQLDASISSKLKSLKNQFSENLYIQNY
ncbi:ATP synthase F1 subunit delta [bacterium]|nr:ATP synthase F1 subunit delta [bacterium]|tara:strand:+ start:152 stop:709 length:558 start_codon:yes stop_codon:yes gene_type:complete